MLILWLNLAAADTDRELTTIVTIPYSEHHWGFDFEFPLRLLKGKFLTEQQHESKPEVKTSIWRGRRTPGSDTHQTGPGQVLWSSRSPLSHCFTLSVIVLPACPTYFWISFSFMWCFRVPSCHLLSLYRCAQLADESKLGVLDLQSKCAPDEHLLGETWMFVWKPQQRCDRLAPLIKRRE